MTFVGRQSGIIEHSYDWRSVVLYALSIGAGQDDPNYVLENLGPHVYPTYGLAVAQLAIQQVLNPYEGHAVHRAQYTRFLRYLPPSGSLFSTASVVEAFDFDGVVFLEVSAEVCDANGTLCIESIFCLALKNVPLTGRPPGRVRRVAWRRPRSASHRATYSIPSNQALLYRLTGDLNPVHACHERALAVGFERPVLHGLCTYGYMYRTLLCAVAHEGLALSELNCEFRQPVYPGDNLTIDWWIDREFVAMEALVGTEESARHVCRGSATLVPVNVDCGSS